MEYLQYFHWIIIAYFWNRVLNLVISGIPSILLCIDLNPTVEILCFKPCYKWNTFNTSKAIGVDIIDEKVLNLVISGIPSILGTWINVENGDTCFKPCYKWNTFNTISAIGHSSTAEIVLNLVISGIPSILHVGYNLFKLAIQGFKPCYKWNTFNTAIGHASTAQIISF